MRRKNVLFALVVALLIVAAPALQAQEKTASDAELAVKNGDLPPGAVASLSVPQARFMLQDAIRKRYIGKMKTCQNGVGCFEYVISGATGFTIRRTGFDFVFTFETTSQRPHSRSEAKSSVRFRGIYCYVRPYRLKGLYSFRYTYPEPFYIVNCPSRLEGSAQINAAVLDGWSDEATAQEYADAYNRLAYASQIEEPLAFAAVAKAWRENPAKPPLNPEADRQRILAENAFNEKKLDSAIEHYESGVEVQPTWPEGWFNLAMIYAEQNNYADAADCMKRYLELVPDASDAKDARTQMIIWEDKAGIH